VELVKATGDQLVKNIVYALAATSALAFGAPAAAQVNAQGNVYAGQQNSYPGQPGTGNRIEQLNARLQAGIQARTITSAEARPIRQQILQLSRLERQYAANGLTQRERQDLQSRLQNVRRQLRLADGGGNGRYASSNNDSYMNDDLDAGYDNGAGYTNGNYNNGNYEDGGYNNQTNYRQVNEICGNEGSGGGGIAAILGSILGGSSQSCLRVGQRINGQLSALPNGYQNQFRNGNGYYYGYLSGNVIEVETNTSVVSRIFVVN
jgi:hypothetical protein